MVADFIDCPKFNLSDEEAGIVAKHLTILLPFEGWMVSAIVILMVIINKVIICMDAIKKKFGKEKPENAPESKDPRDLVKSVYRPEMDTKADQAKKGGE